MRGIKEFECGGGGWWWGGGERLINGWRVEKAYG